VAAFDGLGTRLYADAARRRLGELLGGEQGRALVAQANSWMTGQNIHNPARMTAMLAPGSQMKRRDEVAACRLSRPPLPRRDRLQRAGWSLGETCFGQRWQVDGSNGENKLLATGASQADPPMAITCCSWWPPFGIRRPSAERRSSGAKRAWLTRLPARG
jgi:hypothetical protein